MAQTSVGYSDPQDISNLLEYRLPDWSYRVWDAQFMLNGRGNDGRSAGSSSWQNDFSTNIGTNYFQAWENEQREYRSEAFLVGHYSHNSANESHSAWHSHDLNSRAGFDGKIKQYIGEGPFSILALGHLEREYAEEFQDSRINDTEDHYQFVRRGSSIGFKAGAGWGRVRNVVPLLRAQRLSERLKILDRPGLTNEQVQEIARVFAQEFAYRQVFDRSDRHFWNDILNPMLDTDNPLTPFEIFYLADVLSEDIGYRQQGVSVDVLYSFEEETVSALAPTFLTGIIQQF